MATVKPVSLRKLSMLLGCPKKSMFHKSPVNQRLFTQNSQLLLVAPVTPRPQLPFLYPAARGGRRPAPRKQAGQWQIFRFISTERKQAFKNQVKLTVKFILWGWVFGALFITISYGIYDSRLEANYPAPPMWRWKTRKCYREARFREEPEAFEDGVVNWFLTGQYWKTLLERLEDPTLDGAGLVEQNTEETMIDGVGKTGYDITNKPYEWRRGYWEALMGTARSAENLEGFVRDETRSIVFPPDVVIGPSNPDPRPVPPNAYPAPLEKNCEIFFPPPHIFYMKILTTKGFTTDERMQAALAYADWLDFKKLSETAEEMYRWALDIATTNIDHPESVIDLSSGVIKPDALYVTPSLLTATTSFAIHHARNSNLSAALPIFLSVLRARRALPEPTAPEERVLRHKDPETFLSSVMSFVYPMIFPPPFPPPRPTGDEPASRTPASICDEAGLMAYIGEILFASSSRKDGLKWTREAADLSEKEYREVVRAIGQEEAVQKCRECIKVGFDNWQDMLAKLAEDRNEQKQLKEPPRSGWSLGWGSDKKEVEEDDWAKELLMVEQRARNVQEMLNRDMANNKVMSVFRSLLFI